ncbi:MAG: aspartate aminotransferase family protein, partial [Mesorhizobium sp.]
IRNHVAWSAGLAERLAGEPDFEIVTEPMLSLFSCRHLVAGIDSDEHNLRLVNAINDDGRIYLTQTRVDGQVAIRFQVGQFETTAADVGIAFEVITEIARRLA